MLLPDRRDVLLATGAAAAVQAEMWLYDGSPEGAVVVTATAGLALPASLLLRAGRPDLMATCASVVLASQALLGGRLTSTLSVAVIALVIAFSIGHGLPRRPALLFAALFLLATWFDTLAIDHNDYGVLSDLAFTAVMIVGAPFAAGRALRDRREQTRQLEHLNRELTQEREQVARMSVLDERARIARDMHDVVAHSVSLMVVQAGAARHLLTRDPEQSGRALDLVEQAGRQALAELRRTLGVLREDVGLAPQPTLAQLPSLLSQARRSGLDVRLQEIGEARELPPGVEVAVYRVVQEALTNVVKHAAAAPARVHLTWCADELAVDVTNSGSRTTAAPDTTGYGLKGMAERARMHHGTFTAGPAEGGGFQVRATFPYKLDGSPG